MEGLAFYRLWVGKSPLPGVIHPRRLGIDVCHLPVLYPRLTIPIRRNTARLTRYLALQPA
jgi:hypothetical protein